MNLFFCDENNVEIISIQSDCQPYKIGDKIKIKVYVSETRQLLWKDENIKEFYIEYKIINIENEIRVLYICKPTVKMTTFLTLKEIKKLC